MAEIDNELNNLNRSIKETITLLRDLKQAASGAKTTFTNEAEVKQQERLNALLRERKSLMFGGGAAPTAGGTNFGNTPEALGKAAATASRKVDELREKLRQLKVRDIKEGQSLGIIDQGALKRDIEQTQALLNKQEAALKGFQTRIKNLSSAPAKAGTGINIPGGFQPGDTPYTVPTNKQAEFTTETGKSAAALERARKAAEAARKEEERLASIREKVATDPRYKEALQQAEARNLGIGNLQSIEDRGGNVQRLKFSQTSDGISQQFNPYVNMLSGKSTPGLSSQFRTFGSDIARDIGQFTKWSIAIAAVYTPMQKLGELMAIMVDNESRLADATIAANVPFEKSGEIFDQVAVAANAAGESINTTIDAYTQASRAAGRYSTEAERSQKATALLNDSLILSKLSTLDQADSIDTLSAALLQSDRQLDQGQELLNKWVKVSQTANVGIDALATGVAVLGDAAETSGLSVDQLNGLIAVLSENSISGGKEVANSAKALIGAYQGDKAEAALNKYGIALRKANGEVRDFLEIYKELAVLREQGVLSETSIGEIATALGGGGSRRAKDVSALISGQIRLNQVAEVSASVTGKDTTANDALAKKLETVQTANTRLANSFQELAQTLGDDGGLLDGMKTFINLLTEGVKGMNELFSILGRSGPILATVVTGLGAMNAYYGVGGRRETALARLGAVPEVIGFADGQRQYSDLRGGTGGGLAADILRMNYRGAGIIGGAGVALQGASNIAAGRNENALGNVFGGIVGGAIGAALGGPIGLAAGANIGSAAGDAMVTSLKTHKGDFEDIFRPPEARPRGNFEEIKKFFGIGAPGGQANLPGTLAGLSDDEIQRLLFTAVGGGNEMTGTLRSRNFQYFNNQAYTEGAAALEILKKENPEAAKLFELEKKRREEVEKRTKEIEKQADSPLYKGLQDQAATARQEQLGRLAKGEIGTAEFGRISERLGGFPSVSIKAVTNMGDEIQNVSEDINTATEAYDAFLYIAQYGTQEQINLLSGYSDDIIKLKENIARLAGGENIIGTTLELSFGDEKITSPKQLQDLLVQSQKSLATGLGSTYQQVVESQGQAVTLPPMVGNYNEPLTGGGQDAAVRRGLEIQQQYLVQTGKTAEEIEKFKAAIEAFYAAVDRGSGTQFEAVNGLTQQFYDLGKAAAEAAGELSQINPIGFQKFDVPFATLQNLAQQSLMIGQNWQQKWNYDFKPEDQIAIANDGITQPLHADFKILALLLEKIVDQNQKQLDGQYNIPEGATFWVPLTAAYYRKQNEGGGDLQSMLDSLAVDGNTSATNNNTRALEQLSSVMTNTDRLKLEYPAAQDTAKNPKPLAGFQNEQRLRAEYQVDEYHTPGGLANPMPRVESTSDTALKTSIQQLIDSIKTFFSNGNNQFPNRPGPFGPSTATGATNKSLSNQTQTITPTTKLDLKFSSNINLLVDGRILAQTLQTYMASELLRTEQTQGVVTKRYTL